MFWVILFFKICFPVLEEDSLLNSTDRGNLQTCKYLLECPDCLKMLQAHYFIESTQASSTTTLKGFANATRTSSPTTWSSWCSRRRAASSWPCSPILSTGPPRRGPSRPELRSSHRWEARLGSIDYKATLWWGQGISLATGGLTSYSQ